MSTILFISSYPMKKSSNVTASAGVANYTKNTLLAVKDISPKKTDIVVLAEKLEDESDYSHLGITVKRVWKKNSFSTFPSILIKILKEFRNVKSVVLEFDLTTFGGLVYLLPFPVFLLALKLMRRKVFIINHQVLTSIKEIDPHISTEKNTFKSLGISLGLRIIYSIQLLLSQNVIVFEEELKKKLSEFGSTKKIRVIPRGSELFSKIPTKSASRKKLGIKRNDFVIVSFGYLAWYKGTDWILHALEVAKKKKKNSNIRLILAGGPNPNHMDKTYYTKYIDSITQKADELNVEVTGFVPEKHIAEYYQAADVIVLPYRSHMSASRPLSMAFAFKKPFLLSSQLKYVTTESDVMDLLRKMRISPQKVIFKEPEDFTQKLMLIMKNRTFQNKLSTLSKELSKSRSWEIIGKMYYDVLSV